MKNTRDNKAMKWFTPDELTRSETAHRLGIDNCPDGVVMKNLQELVRHVLDPAREMWGRPIRVTSGYRCTALNAAVGGSRNSQHITGRAADITVGSRNENSRLFAMIRDSDIPYDQLINERDYSWIHVSYAPCGRRQVLAL